jgi:hypothetical protein
MEVSGQIHAPTAMAQSKGTRYPSDMSGYGTQIGLNVDARNRNQVPRSSSQQPGRYTEWALDENSSTANLNTVQMS